ncbi:MAG: hypothetical protein J5835_03190 [Bacteroidales bacterium]|nr:hypothetical protein [Bacteroidales bacterium]
MKTYMRLLFAGLLAGLLFLSSCTKDDRFSYSRSSEATAEVKSTVTPQERGRNVMLLYSAGYNSLYGYLSTDIKDLEYGFIPAGTQVGTSPSGHVNGMSEPVLLVYSRNGYDKDPKAPESALFRLYRRPDDTVVKDTIKVWGSGADAASEETMREVITIAHDLYPASKFGVVFSSHSSGWLPEGYYSDPDAFEKTDWFGVSARAFSGKREYPPIPEEYPAVKSFGQDNYPDHSVEMSLKAFADAIPFCMDYLLIDACLSGGVEVALQFRGKADIVAFSQAEILADGFNYEMLAERLLKGEPDPVAVARDYYSQYESRTGTQNSATISVVDTRQMDDLVSVCKTLFEKYRNPITKGLKGVTVQGFYRFNRHFFFDLRDILVKAGINASETEAFDAAMDKCIIYKAATPYFFQGGTDGFKINTFSGLSMYLPAKGTEFLDNYYKGGSILWNEETELVK